MSRTTGQGITVIESGAPASAISLGMPTADSVDAAIARVAAVAEAAQVLAEDNGGDGSGNIDGGRI